MLPYLIISIMGG